MWFATNREGRRTTSRPEPPPFQHPTGEPPTSPMSPMTTARRAPRHRNTRRAADLDPRCPIASHQAKPCERSSSSSARRLKIRRRPAAFGRSETDLAIRCRRLRQPRSHRQLEASRRPPAADREPPLIFGIGSDGLARVNKERATPATSSPAEMPPMNGRRRQPRPPYHRNVKKNDFAGARARDAGQGPPDNPAMAASARWRRRHRVRAPRDQNDREKFVLRKGNAAERVGPMVDIEARSIPNRAARAAAAARAATTTCGLGRGQYDIEIAPSDPIEFSQTPLNGHRQPPEVTKLPLVIDWPRSRRGLNLVKPVTVKPGQRSRPATS